MAKQKDDEIYEKCFKNTRSSHNKKDPLIKINDNSKDITEMMQEYNRVIIAFKANKQNSECNLNLIEKESEFN